MARLIFGIIVMAVMGVIADKKGFNPWAWVLAGGLIGVIILLALPSANADGLDDATRDARAKRGNTVGTVISALAVVLIVVILAVVSNM